MSTTMTMTMRRDAVSRLVLHELHARHAQFARTLNKSEHTIAWYAMALNDYCRFLEEVQGLPARATLKDFTLDGVRDYILHLRGRTVWAGHPAVVPREARPLSDRSINCYVRSLRAFATWLYEQEYTETNVLARLKPPKVTKRAVEILTDEEIGRVLAVLAAPTATNARNRAIFLTFLDTGIRAGELLSLTLSRLHLEEGYLMVLGKGKKERPVKIGHTAAQAIRLYLARYRPQPARPDIMAVFLTEGYRVLHRAGESGPGTSDIALAAGRSRGQGWARRAQEQAHGRAQQEEQDQEEQDQEEQEQEELLLFSEPGWPLTQDALKSLFHRLRTRADVPRLHPHLLRHTYACRYLLAHRDPLALKTMLGHTTLAMTNHYVEAVEGMQVIRSDRVSVVDAMELPIGRLERGHGRGVRRSRSHDEQ
jgi:site-specific recombinase XerD